MAMQNHKNYNAGDAVDRHDPLNLHEYMMSDARPSPQLDTLLHNSPSPSLACTTLSPFGGDFSKSTGRTYSNTFTHPFDPTQVSSPKSATSNSGSQVQQSLDNHILQNSLHRRSLNPNNALDPSPKVDALEPIDTSNFGRAGNPTSGDHIDTEDNPTQASADREYESSNSKRFTEKDKADNQAPWSEMRTKAGKERKRLPLACIACRRKKIRCSGEKPACKHCLRSRIPCVYKVTTRKAAPRTDYMAMLDKRLKRMEERVIRLIPKESQPSVPRAIVKPNFPVPSGKSTGRKRAADEAFGPDLDLEKWAKSRLTSKVDTSVMPVRVLDPEEKGLLTEGVDSLPSKEIQQHLAEVYFDYVYGQSYPLLHKPSFLRRLAAGDVAPVLVLAVCAVSARFSNHPKVRTEPAFLRGEEWARAARDIALKRYDTPNITILTVYLLLGLHEFGTCQGGRSWMLAGMAQRMAFALLLHKDLDRNGWGRDRKDRLSPTDREIRRRTMWACFLMDRFNASGSDRPMQMSEDFVNIPLPIKEHYFQMELTAPTETLEGQVLRPVKPDTGQMADAKQNMGTSAYYIRLIAIWGRLVGYWNLGGREKEKYPMWSMQSEFHTLREAIRSFHANLPASMRWNPENLQNHASEKIANQFVFVHLVYYQLTLFMNRFALPYSGFGRPSKDMPQQFHTEAARSAIEAANQVSLLVKEALDHNVTAPFAGYCAFYSSTVHIPGVFSKNARIEALSKQNLAYNVKYLSKIKKYWGMFHFVAENLKELYRQHADMALKGSGVAATATATADQILQYGDWFDRYPHGVSKTDYEDPASAAQVEPGTDAVLAQKSDLQSVEEFFATLSPPSKAAQLRKQAKKSKSKKVARQSSTDDKSDKDEIESPVLPHSLQDNALGISQDPDFGNAYLGDGGFGNFGAVDHSMFNYSVPLGPSGMLSQLDRHLVLSSYAGMDLSSANAITNTMGNGDTQLQSSSGLGQNSFATNNGMADMWNLDFNSMNGVSNGFGGAGLSNDASTAWFTPFNLDPPNVMGDDGLFSGVLMGQGPGAFDFGMIDGLDGNGGSGQG